MNALERALIRLAADLRELDVPWALVGGFAVVLRTDPRLTRDIDVAVSVTDDAEAEGHVSDLVARGYTIREHLEQEATGRLASVRLSAPADFDPEVVVDLLFASSGIEPEIVGRAEVMEVLPDLHLPVATTGDLIALKVLADRYQDRIDLENLLRDAATADLDQARAAVRRIAERGYGRTRDLAQDLESRIAEAAGDDRPAG